MFFSRIGNVFFHQDQAKFCTALVRPLQVALALAVLSVSASSCRGRKMSLFVQVCRNSGSMPHMPQGFVHIVSGEDDYLSGQRVQELKTAVCRTLPEAEIIELDAATCTAFDFDQAVSPSLLSDASIVLMSHGENMDEEVGTALVEYCQRFRKESNPVSIVIVRHNGSTKGSGIIKRAQKAGAVLDPIESLKKPDSRKNFVLHCCEKRKRRITPDAAQLIVDVLTDKTGEIAALCEQLCDDFPQDPISRNQVETYLSADPRVTGFNVADRAISGNVAQAVLGLRSALAQGVDPLAIIGAIAMKIRAMAKASAVDRGTITPAEARMAPWQLRNARKDVRGWTSQGLGKCIQTAAWADEQCKSSGTDPLYAMEILVETLAKKGRISASDR